jgi:F-type H+-transporting ATPase subunit delta
MSELTTAARPYARAVFELARDSKSFDIWSERLQLLSAVVTDSTVVKLLDSPKMTFQEKAQLIEKVSSDYLDDKGQNFVRVLAENDRLILLKDIYKLYEQYRAESEGSIEASVVSAIELNEEQTQALVKALSKRLERKVKIVNTTDSSLIAGAIIRAGDLVIDGSVKGKLQNLTQTIAG